MLGQNIVVDDRGEAEHPGVFVGGLLLQPGRRLEEASHRRGRQQVVDGCGILVVDGRAASAGEQLDEVRRPLRRGIAAVDGIGGSALGDCADEQVLGRWCCHQSDHRVRARGLSEDGHIRGIATERGDVGVHPAQRFDLVSQPEVALEGTIGCGVATEVEIAERAQPVVEAHIDHGARVDETASLL